MTKIFGPGLLCLLIIGSLQAQQNKICVTVDDLPVVNYGIDDSAFVFGVTQGLIDTFDKYGIPAIGYVNENKLYTDDNVDSLKLQHLEMWVKNGYDLGNHTFAHRSYHQTAFELYADDIVKGEQMTRPLMSKYGKELKYFRHPYLHAGLRQTHYDSLNSFLEAYGYEIAPVTIDNADYLFAKAYSDAYKSKDTLKMEEIGRAYVDYMERKLVYFERQSEKLFGRNISQTLLIHANYLNAQYLDDLAEVYLNHGYQFVSQNEVLKDPAYQSDITRFGNWGISWLDRWALSQGKSGDFFEGDPQVPEFIR